MAHSRQRSLSLELDYGDPDPDMDHDGVIAGHGYPAQPPAGAASPDPPKPSTSSSTLPPAPVHGLPVNPLTGLRPGAASASPAPAAGGAPNSRMTAVYIGDLHWWTSDADIVHLAGLAGLEVPFKDVVFAEHKVNGKSKGVVWVECGAADKAQQLKTFIDNNEYQLKKMTASLTYGGHPSPLRTLPKEPARAQNVPISRSFASLPASARPPPSATTAYLHPHPGQNRRDHPVMPGHLGPGGGAGAAGLGAGVGGGGMAQGGGVGGGGGMRRSGPPPQQGQGMQHGVYNPAFGGGAPNNNNGGAGVFNPAFNSGGNGAPPQQQQAPPFDMNAFAGMGAFGMPGMAMGGFGMPGMGAMGAMGGMGGMGMGMPGMGMGMGGIGMGGFDMGAFGAGGGMGMFGSAGGGMDALDGGAKKRSRTDG